ncbi:hypothetical protein [Ureibacillus acetophenoni]|uniref:LEA14-like dessication related protein n=1 Tax=Ureibacillus acetophenoni TaxID=614649 RepID=A0A285UIC3_9BACL|nr:hypothetical protein [Ureibacillus acetophenoni]SOC41523.1 hypothetical protein SAMN05877842_110134 [Ureibacillus acetophenoni]
MKKRNVCLIFFVILLGTLFGCSANKESFDDRNISFYIVEKEATAEYESYRFEIANNTGYELTHLIFNLSYPIKELNGSKSNPYEIEGKPVNADLHVNLKSGETMTFLIDAPIKEVFGDTDLLDIEYPNIKLRGYYKDGKEEIPFGISGGLSVLIAE